MATLIAQVTDVLASKLSLSDRTNIPASATPEVAVKSKEAEIPKPVQPDISYHPEEANWKARTARRLAQDPSLPKTPLPEGFPEKLDSPLVWSANDYTDPSQWEYVLNEAQLKEIDDAVKHFNSLDKPLGYISPETFPLPTLGPILNDLSKELHDGRGFFVLKTIPVDSYSRGDNVLIYAGIGSYVGSLRAVQNRPTNGVVAHIRDLTSTNPLKTIGAPAYTNDKQVFHTDIGDIIALYVLEVAQEGGTSRISSAWRVYNELASTRPDLIKTLSEPWPFDGFGADPAYTSRPLLYHLSSRVIIQYARRLFTGFLGLPRSPGIPPITEAQAEALDALHFLAEKEAIGLSFEKGDIQFINNLSVFHGRDGYTDSETKTRHLLRLWLRNEELAWDLPIELKESWKKLYYTATPDQQEFALEPEILNFDKGKDGKSERGPY